jgi:hypothetical protein
VKVFSKSVLVLLALAVAGTPARSRSLHIAGTAGYLSEWQFDGEVAETATSGELVGPLVWKHIGLCSVNGPQVSPARFTSGFRGRVPRPRSMRQFYSTARGALIAGTFSGSSEGRMDCPDVGAIPLSISIK